MNFQYPSHRVHEIIKAEKSVANGHPLKPERVGEAGAKFHAFLDMVDGPILDLRFLGKAGRIDMPEKYDATLLLSAERVRGIGFCPVERQNFRAKLRIPEGWHQNICDPCLPTTDPARNRHEPLSSFAPTDFEDFIHKVADLWNIDLKLELSLL